MMETFLIPEKTTISGKGDGPAVDVSAAASRVLLATLNITRIIEQESLDISVFGSADGTNFAQKLASFPQKFYRGTHPLLLDLRAHPEVKFVRGHWETARWGRGVETPMFEFQITLKEVPAEMLSSQAGSAAHATK